MVEVGIFKLIHTTLLVLIIAITGCATDTDSSNTLYAQNYQNTLNCEKRPGYTKQPLSLTENYFNSTKELNACKKSIDSYAKEIARWKKCRVTFLEQFNKQVISNVDRTKLCLLARHPKDPPCAVYKLPTDLKTQGSGAPNAGKKQRG